MNKSVYGNDYDVLYYNENSSKNYIELHPLRNKKFVGVFSLANSEDSETFVVFYKLMYGYIHTFTIGDYSNNKMLYKGSPLYGFVKGEERLAFDSLDWGAYLLREDIGREGAWLDIFEEIIIENMPAEERKLYTKISKS